MTVTIEENGTIHLPATIDFRQQRVITPGPQGYPPAEALPGGIAESTYSPLIVLPNGVVLNAPVIANDTGHGAKVLNLDFTANQVAYQETEGRYEDKTIHYASFVASNPAAAAMENVPVAPALDLVPNKGDEEVATSAREGLIAFVNGQTGRANDQRQGLNSALLDNLDPFNILHEVPVLTADIGDPAYSPMWDVRLVQWSQAAMASGANKRQAAFGDVEMTLTASGAVTGMGGTPFGAAGIVIDCPLMSIEIPNE
jgi:hypothetical protein